MASARYQRIKEWRVCWADTITTGDNEMSEEVKPLDLEYYRAVAKIQTNPDILKAELLDLIKESEVWNTRTPPEQNCKSFCKLFASAKTRDEFFAEKCRICKEGRTEDKWASFHERRNK
jgi:hypothetical protein